MKFSIQLFSLVFLLTLLSAPLVAQDKNCTKFKTGTFRIVGPNSNNIIIERTNDKQVENKIDERIRLDYKIEWQDDCNFTLIPSPQTQSYYHYPSNAVFRYKIIATTETSYRYISTSNFSKSEERGELILVK